MSDSEISDPIRVDSSPFTCATPMGSKTFAIKYYGNIELEEINYDLIDKKNISCFQKLRINKPTICYNLKLDSEKICILFLDNCYYDIIKDKINTMLNSIYNKGLNDYQFHIDANSNQVCFKYISKSGKCKCVVSDLTNKHLYRTCTTNINGTNVKYKIYAKEYQLSHNDMLELLNKLLEII